MIIIPVDNCLDCVNLMRIIQNKTIKKYKCVKFHMMNDEGCKDYDNSYVAD